MDRLDTINKKSRSKILVVGLGGIGSNLIDCVVPALEHCNFNVEIHLMDDDEVELNNLGHQKYFHHEVGQSKAISLVKRYSNLETVKLIAVEEALGKSEQLEGYDVIIVAVDRTEPRELVHESKVDWLDLRCQGDGWIIIDSNTDSKIINSLPQSKKPTSCQIPGAIENGNIEFGFAVVSAIGAQWLFQKIRIINGAISQLPSFGMGYLTHGEIIPKLTRMVIND